MSVRFRYRIRSGDVSGKSNLRFAVDEDNGTSVVLKFYATKEQYENAKRMHRLTKGSRFVCKSVFFVFSFERSFFL